MKYPCLVPKQFCTTPIKVTIQSEGVDENGAPIILFEADLKANFQSPAKIRFTDEQKIVMLEGAVALFSGDICPGIETISNGWAEVFGAERRIAKGAKWRNPDGTVNYTRLDLI